MGNSTSSESEDLPKKKEKNKKYDYLEEIILSKTTTSMSKNLMNNVSSIILPVTQLVPKKNNIYDDYLILDEVLGEGVNGKVLACIHKNSGVRYALKPLKDKISARREIDLQWRCCQGCPYIVQIKDVYEKTIGTTKMLLVVMECMTGGELFSKIRERSDDSNPFTERAVQHLHKNMNVAHRDLKPENLLISTNDSDALIKICDFGFAKENSDGLKTPCYTPYYVPPEVLNAELPGSAKYDLACDIWSLGVIMYILCSGKPPFFVSPGHRSNISTGMKNRIKQGQYSLSDQCWKNVSSEAKELIRKMLETNPEHRLNIEELMNSNWICKYLEVPSTPLPTLEVFRENETNLREINEEMGLALKEITIDDGQNVKLKSKPNNPMLKAREKKVKAQKNEVSASPPETIDAPVNEIKEKSENSNDSNL